MAERSRVVSSDPARQINTRLVREGRVRVLFIGLGASGLSLKEVSESSSGVRGVFIDKPAGSGQFPSSYCLLVVCYLGSAILLFSSFLCKTQ